MKSIKELLGIGSGARFLKEGDVTLMLFSLSAVFGILHFSLLYLRISDSPWSGLLTVMFVMFWLAMAFSCGRRRSRSFLISSAVIWGCSLAYYMLNAFVFASHKEILTSGTAGSILSAFSTLLMLFAVATVLPLIPGLNTLGVIDNTLNENDLLIYCICAIVVIAAAYVVGILWQKRFLSKVSVKKEKVIDGTKFNLKD